jgi:lysyl-tRNA synthetase class 2
MIYRMQHQPFWAQQNMARKLPFVKGRATVVRTIRQFFDQQGFTEVETPILQVSPGMEPHLRTFATHLEHGLGGQHVGRHLQTSPEFTMKKLLAAGMPQIYQLARCFRNGEFSRLHHPEFTMLEWYRSHAPYTQLMDDCASLLKCVENALGQSYQSAGKTCSAQNGVEKRTVAEAFFQYVDLDIFATVTDLSDPDPNPQALAAALRHRNIYVGAEDRWEDLFFRVFMEYIEPNLGVGKPTILYDYPISMAALSRPKKNNPMLAERFELYVCGAELANAFGELTDANEQRRRFQQDLDLRQQLYGTSLPVDEDFLQAVAHMPPASGIALGVDRLAMLATHAAHINDVLWAPVDPTGLPLA